MSADDPVRNERDSKQQEQRTIGAAERLGTEGAGGYEIERTLEGVDKRTQMRTEVYPDKRMEKRADSADDGRMNDAEEPDVGPRRQVSVELGARTYRVSTTATSQQLDEIVQMVEQRALQVGGRRGVTEESVVLASLALAHELSKEKARADWLGERLEVTQQGQRVTERSIVRLGERVTALEEQNEQLRGQSVRVRGLLEAMLDRVERALEQVQVGGVSSMARGLDGEVRDDMEDGEDR